MQLFYVNFAKRQSYKGVFYDKRQSYKEVFYDKRQSYNGVFVTDFQSKQTARDRGERHSFMYKILIMGAHAQSG